MRSLNNLNVSTMKIFPEPLNFEEAVQEVIKVLDNDNENAEMSLKYSVQAYFGMLEEKESYNQMFFKHLMHNEVKALLPFISEVLSEHHRGNPIFRGEVDRESLAGIVDRVYRRIQSRGGLPHYGRREGSESWCIRALINILVLMELLIW